MSILCSLVGASFTVVAAAQILRAKNGIRALGNAQVSTTQSKFGGSSLALDGSGDKLEIPYSSDLALGTTSWTVEYWIRITTQTGGYTNTVGMWDDTTADGAAYYFSCNMYDTTNSMGVQYFYGGNNSGPITFGGTLTTGTWQHHAFVKNGNTLTAYKDGVSQGTHDMTGRTISPYNTTYTTLKIGGLVTGGYLNGYMDEIRISNTARYTANFTAPTTAFVNDDNTVLLVHANGTNATTFFEDDNGGRSPKGIRALGNAQVDTAQSKFGGASALFDGTGDYLTVENIQGDITEDFTFEFWVRFNDLPGTSTFRMVAGDGAGGQRYFGLLNDGGTYRWEAAFYSNTYYVERFTATVTTGVWYHIALTKSGATVKVYQNGTSLTSNTSFGTMLSTRTFYASGTNYIGSWNTSSYFLNGWLDEIRVSNNVRYTANFTPSTTAFVNDANTVLLVHADGTDASTVFRDDNGIRSQKGVQAIGNAQVSTAQSKFGGASSLYDGNGDYLQLANSSDYNFTGNYTIEGWWYQPSNVAAGIYPTLIGTGAVSDNKGWAVTSEPTTNKVLFITSGDGSSGMQVLLTSASLSAATWNHWAVVRNNSVLTVYINGTASGSTYTTTGNSIASTYPLYIGGGIGGLSSGNFSSSSATVVNLNGYQDEIRLSNSARYTAAFTPSTTPFQNDDNTVLLLHMDGTNASTVFFDDNGAKPYTP